MSLIPGSLIPEDKYTTLEEREAKQFGSLPTASPEPALLLSMMRLAIEKDGVEALERIKALYREEQDRQAAREFFAALADFQALCSPIAKTSTAKVVTKSGTSFQYEYAELDEIARHVREAGLHQRGFSYGWDSIYEESPRRITAVCTLRHANGHSEKASFQAPVDASAAMNDTQKAASALTYAKRQSLVQVLGLSTADPDTDVRSESVEKATEAQVQAIEAALAKAGKKWPGLLDWLKRDTALDLTQDDYVRAMRALGGKP